MDAHVKQLLLLGREHFQRGDYERAEYLLKQVAVRADRFADVFDMLGVIAHSRGDFSLAEKHFRRALELNPAYTEARLNLVVTYTYLGKYEEASALSSSMERRAGDELARGKIANLHAEVAQAYEHAGLTREAIGELEKAVRLGPHFSDLRVRLAKLLREIGETERAVGELGRAIDANPRYVSAYLELALLHLSQGRRGAALEALAPVQELEPDNRRANVYRRAAEQGARA
jgi:tetratricopeptide (TPR) repeat protein